MNQSKDMDPKSLQNFADTQLQIINQILEKEKTPKDKQQAMLERAKKTEKE